MSEQRPRALITGLTGQDGSYLAEHLLELGYEVHGLVRRASGGFPPHLSGLLARVRLVEGDLVDQASLHRAVRAARPDEIYHLAAQSFVARSWSEPVHTAEVTGLGALRMLEAARDEAPRARFFQPSSSEMYGNGAGPFGPDGPFRPRSPYGAAKVFAHASAVNYRESFGMYVACGVLFNHESPRRGPEFVTRKICRAAARHERVRLGNLDARRDWGWAPDYVRAMRLLLQLDAPSDVVVATGVSHSVRDLADLAYAAVGLDWRDYVETDPQLRRPAEIHALTGDPADAERRLGWRPTVDFRELVERMVAEERSA